MILLLLFIFSLAQLPSFTFAQSNTTNFSGKSASQVRWDEQKQLVVEYEAPALNKNPNQVETQRLILRDSVTKKWVVTELRETDQNSGNFQSSVRLSFAPQNGAQGYILEVYFLPEQKTLDDVNNLLEAGTLIHKLYYIFQDRNIVRLQIYDSREQLKQAYQTRIQALIDKGVLKRSTLGAFTEKKRSEQVQDLKKQAVEAEQQRQIMEKTEQEKRLEGLRQEKALEAKERARRKEEASKIATQALEFYNKEHFSEAEPLFKKATELDPETSSYFYQYGVTLYKLDQFTKSLSILDLANDPSINTTEKQYFRALDLLKLKDFAQARKEFENVVLSEDSKLKTMAVFFTGVLDLQLEQFDLAKKEFEWVIDHSEDHNLDNQAEAYLDQIANAQAFLQKKSKRWTINLAGGFNYDSNILNAADANAATNIAGLRTTYQAFAEYRALYEETREWAVQGNYSDVYSTNTNFSSNSTYSAVDPQELTLYAPYRWRGTAFGTSGQFTFSPGYEQINMDVSSVGSRTPIIESYVGRLDWTFLENENRLEVYSAEFRRDVSLVSQSDVDQLSAYKLTFVWNNTWFRDLKKETAWTLESSLADNNADGANQTYYQLNAAIDYSQPWLTNNFVNARLGLSYSDYAQNSLGRKDSALQFSAGLRHPLTPKLSALFIGTVLTNNSSESLYTYSKYTLSASLNWLTDL